jgi:hypothetical protein
MRRTAPRSVGDLSLCENSSSYRFRWSRFFKAEKEPRLAGAV